MFLEFINLVTKHLFTCLKSDQILLKSQIHMTGTMTNPMNGNGGFETLTGKTFVKNKLF